MGHTNEQTEIPNETINESVDLFTDFNVILDETEDLVVHKKGNFNIVLTIKYTSNVESMRWDLYCT